MDKKGKSKQAITPSPLTTGEPKQQPRSQGKRGKKKRGKKSVPGVNPASRQEAKLETALASALENVSTGKPPSAVPYTEMNKAQKYALGLVDPIHFPTRIPDADSNASAMFRSYEVYEIPVKTGSSLSNSGAFAIAIQPKIGDTITPGSYKVAIADPNLISDNPQATDWSAGSSYISRLGSMDPRMVNEIDTLALNEAGFFSYGMGSAPTAAQPLGTDPVEHVGNGFIDVNYNNSNGDIILPVGQFLINSQILVSGGNLSTITLGAGTGTSPTITALTTASGLASTNGQQSWMVTTTPEATHIRLSSTISAGSIFASSINIVPAARTDIPQALTNGMIEKVRPTACCYWLTYTGTTLKDGGKVATAVVNGDALSSRFFSEGSTGNNGNFRSLEGVGMVPGAITDKLKTGVYGYIKPNNSLDWAYYPVDQHNAYKYNSGVIYGQFEPDDGLPTATTSPLRLIVCTVYEYQTTSQIPELAINKGSDSQVSAALNFLAALPNVMTNDEHTGFWDKVKSALYKVTHGIKGAMDKGSSFLKTIQSYEPAAQQMLQTLMPMLAV